MGALYSWFRKRKNRIHPHMVYIGFFVVLFFGVASIVSQRAIAAERSDQFREHQEQLNVDYKEHEDFNTWAKKRDTIG